MTNRKKQSLLIGALTSSFGIFVSKLLGLFYVVPLNSIAGEGNMVFYSITYTYYDILLKICSAGVPFAIAALVAKYYSREDYKTVLLVKKLGSSFLLVSSFVVACIFLAISGPLSKQAMGSMALASDIHYLNNLFKILALALVFVPFLSSLRGYYQGLKEMQSYAASQVIEQFVRVASIICLGFVCVNLFNLEQIYAIYMAMLAASLGAISAIVYFVITRKGDDKELKELAALQTGEAQSAKYILSEMLSLGIPYLIISFLGTTSSLINSNYFMDYATSVGVAYDEAKLVLGILQVNCNKIAAIPQVLTIGFSAGLVPYLTESLEKRDYAQLQKHVMDILNTVLYILVPIVTWLFIYAKPVYYIMYGAGNLELGASLFAISCLTTFTDTIAPIISNMCITLRQRRNTVISLVIGTIIKFVSFFLFIKMFGYVGMVYSTAFSSIVVILMNLFVLKLRYHIDYKNVIKHIFMMVIGSLVSCLPLLIAYTGFTFTYDGRIMCIVILAIYGILSLLIYLGVTALFGLPQTLMNKSFKDILNKILRKIRKA